MRMRYCQYLFLTLLLLTAFGMRLYAIDQQDIWGDEAFSIWLSRQPLAQVIAGGADTHPPGYPLMLALWLRVVGVSPLAVRTLSALQSFLLIPVIYILGKRAFASQTGFLAAFFAALSPGLLYYAQETRMYSQAVLFSALSCFFFLRTIESRPTWITWLAYIGSALAAGYTHYYTFFVICAQNLVMAIWLLVRLRAARQNSQKTFVRWSSVQLALICAYVPWILAQQSFLSSKASARIAEWTLTTLLHITLEALTGIGAGLSLIPTEAQALMLPFLVTGIVGMSGLIQARTHSRAIAAFLWVPIGIAWLVNPIMPFFFPRYLLVIAPAFYLLVAAGITVLARLWRPLGLLSATVLLLNSGLGAHAYYADAYYVRGRYGQMMQYVTAHIQSGDALLWANPLQVRILEYYQPRELATYLITAGNPPGNPQTGETLDVIIARHPRLWLVRFGNQAEYDPTDSINSWLATHASKAHYSTWDGSDLALYIPKITIASPIHPLEFALGDTIHLVGYRLSAVPLAPGDTLMLTLYWRADAPVAGRYTVFTHLLDASGTLWAQMDSEPQGGSLPTDRWPTGDVIQDNYALTLPADAPPGKYTLQVGMYVLETGVRLPISETHEDFIILQNVEVLAP